MARTGKKATPIDKYGLHKQENRGAPTLLTEELILQIEELVKSGANNQKIITTLEIDDKTFYSWLYRNTQGIKDKLPEWRREYLLSVAEEGFTDLAKSKNERIRLESMKFLTERLGKKWYSTREEHKLLEDNEGSQLEPENKERIDKLLTTPQDSVQSSSPVLSPIQPENT